MRHHVLEMAGTGLSYEGRNSVLGPPSPEISSQMYNLYIWLNFFGLGGPRRLFHPSYDRPVPTISKKWCLISVRWKLTKLYLLKDVRHWTGLDFPPNLHDKRRSIRATDTPHTALEAPGAALFYMGRNVIRPTQSRDIEQNVWFWLSSCFSQYLWTGWA